MGLNIKNEEVHRLVQELAHLTGESQTDAVKHAVEARLRALKGDKAEKILAIGRDCAARLDARKASSDHAKILNGDSGLPE